MGVEGWELTIEGHHHRVETHEAATLREVVWTIDGEPGMSVRKAGREIELTLPEDDPRADHVGSIRAVYTTTGRPRRVTWFGGDRAESMMASVLSRRGVDLDPDKGSPAARREAQARERPWLYASRHVVGGALAIGAPILLAGLLAWLASRVTLPSVDLPSIPWPDWDLPDIPWPDWSMPDWWHRVAEVWPYVAPGLLGLLIARREVRRRREQDLIKAQLPARGTQPAGEEDEDAQASRSPASSPGAGAPSGHRAAPTLPAPPVAQSGHDDDV